MHGALDPLRAALETVSHSGMVGTGHIMIVMVLGMNGNTPCAQIMIGMMVVTTWRALNEMFHVVGFYRRGVWQGPECTPEEWWQFHTGEGILRQTKRKALHINMRKRWGPSLSSSSSSTNALPRSGRGDEPPLIPEMRVA